jgi:hypothetical protein
MIASLSASGSAASRSRRVFSYCRVVRRLMSVALGSAPGVHSKVSGFEGSSGPVAGPSRGSPIDPLTARCEEGREQARSREEAHGGRAKQPARQAESAHILRV